MKHLLIICIILSLPLAKIHAQVVVEKEENPVFHKPDTFAKFEKSPAWLEAYFKKNLVYPPQAKRMDVKGKVFVRLLIEADGSVSDIKIAKGIGAGCDEEAYRLVKSLPTGKWTPATIKGMPVRSYYHIPVIFRIDE